MKASFARGIAKNVRVIAECTAQIAAIDQIARDRGYTPQELSEARVELCRKVDKAEANIAQFLFQPGAQD